MITLFNVDRKVTYSDDLLPELFALAIFNTRFPSVYAHLFEKNNFLSALIKAYSNNENLFNGFKLSTATTGEAPELGKFRELFKNLVESDKTEFLLFIKISNFLIYSSNWEILLFKSSIFP